MVNSEVMTNFHNMLKEKVVGKVIVKQETDLEALKNDIEIEYIKVEIYCGEFKFGYKIYDVIYDPEPFDYNKHLNEVLEFYKSCLMKRYFRGDVSKLTDTDEKLHSMLDVLEPTYNNINDVPKEEMDSWLNRITWNNAILKCISILRGENISEVHRKYKEYFSKEENK